MTGCISQGERREIVSANMSAEVEIRTAPVAEVRVLRKPLIVLTILVGSLSKSSLAHIGRQQTVNIILHQQLDVFVHSGLHRTIKECHLLQIEVFRI